MQKNTTLTHSSNTWILCFSRFFERSAYYGFRAILILYLMEFILKDRTKSIEFYGFFTSAVYFAYLIGGLLGDLVLKSRNALLVGGIAQAIGMILIYFTGNEVLVFNFVLLALGTGLYSPNILSLFGQNYRNNQGLLHSGFTIFYLFVNLGAGLGVIGIGVIQHKFGFGAGFISSAVLALLGAFLPMLLKDGETFEKPNETKNKFSWSPLKIIGVILLSTVFWMCYEFVGGHLIDIVVSISQSMNNTILTSNMAELSMLFFIPLSIAAFFFLRYYLFRSTTLLIIGFLISAASLLLIINIPQEANSGHLPQYFGYVTLFSFAEILIIPTLLSILVKSSNLKYLGIIFGVYLFSSALLNKILSYIYTRFSGNGSFPSLLSIIGSFVFVGAALIIYFYVSKRKKVKNTHLSN